jgi:hypothetical protein
MTIETQEAPLVSPDPPESGGLVRPSLDDGLKLFGLPPVFWIGSAIFLFIFVMMFGAYL